MNDLRAPSQHTLPDFPTTLSELPTQLPGLECAAGLDILVAKAKLPVEQIRPGKERLQKIVRLLIGLIKRNSTRDYDKGKPAD